MPPKAGIQVEGLRELTRDLRKADSAIPKQLTRVHKDLARDIVSHASARAPRRSGRLVASMRTSASAKSAAVMGPRPGGKVAYFGVQEFGGTTPVRRGVKHPVRHIKPYRGGTRGLPWWDDEGAGYFLHPAARDRRKAIMDGYLSTLVNILEEGGFNAR